MSETLVLELLRVVAWGMLATLVIILLSFASQGLGWSRMNFPLLLGTLFAGERKAAMVLGLCLQFLSGLPIALGYYVLLALLGYPVLPAALVLALLHALVLLGVVLPMLPQLHPRMVGLHDGPSEQRRLQPPGFLGLNYGSRTPVVVIVAYLVYGAILGWGYGP